MQRGLKLIGIAENQTVRRQQQRGAGHGSGFNAAEFQKANTLVLDVTYIFDSAEEGHISRQEVEELIPRVLEAQRKLLKEEGDIRDGSVVMTGWQDLPEQVSPEHLQEIKAAAREWSGKIDAFVSLGIGGSYLGLEATFKALTHAYFNQLSRQERGDAPEIYFLGQNLDPDYFRDTLDMLAGKRVGLNVISKSGTTLETAVAFRILERLLEENWGRKSREMIWATTDREKGALKRLAQKKGYRTFSIPDNIGGRFSVLTDAGLFGLAVAGIDIEEFTAGFRNMRRVTMKENFWQNPALVHAAVRFAAWQNGKKIEVVAVNSPALYGLARWMEQLFPESEGHQGRGLWVSPTLYSEKLHANGQMIQQGERNILETFLALKEHDNTLTVPANPENLDGLNYLSEKQTSLNQINQKVMQGPAYAHYQGGVPSMTIELPCRSAYNLGQFYYMMEKSVALSGYLFGHNPFIQPGVEAYKNAMFALLGRPGFEAKAATMQAEMENRQRICLHAD